MNQKLIIEKNFNLALENHQKNNLQNAERIYKKILKINPNHFQSICFLGTLSIQTKNFEKGKQLFYKAIEIQPNNANIHNNLGTVFKELGEFRKAINYFQKTIEFQPDHADAHYNLGIVFKELGEFQKAISCYQKVIQIKPDYTGVHYNLGSLLKSLGEFQKARDSYQRGLEYEPDNLNYYYQLSHFKKELLNPSFKKKIINIIKKNNATKKNLAYGNFLLAKYEEQLKNYRKEFNYLLKGHQYYFESKERKFIKEAEYLLDKLPQIKKLVTLNKLNQNSRKINYKIKPIFIVGVPRCGSTLVEKIIASGAKYIPIGEETGIINNFIRQKIEQKQSLNLDINNSQTILFEKYKQIGLIQKKSDYIFTDKSLDNFFYIELIKEIFPDAKLINCKRDILSTIISILKNNLVDIPWAHNLEHIFKYINIYYETCDLLKKIFPNFIYELQYEKLVNNPEIESKKLLEFCNLPWDIKCLEFYKRKDIISLTASSIQIRKSIYKDSIEKYVPYRQLLNKYRGKYYWFN